jgi:hypothetical protein
MLVAAFADWKGASRLLVSITLVYRTRVFAETQKLGAMLWRAFDEAVHVNFQVCGHANYQELRLTGLTGAVANPSSVPHRSG